MAFKYNKADVKNFVEKNPAVPPQMREYFKYVNDNLLTWPTTTTTTTTTTSTTTTSTTTTTTTT